MAKNRATRNRAIQNIIDFYIGFDGELQEDPDFTALLRGVTELRNMGRSEAWLAGIDRYQHTVEYAASRLRMQYDGELHQWSDLTYEGKREYNRLFKWAILQGSVYATAVA